VHRSFKEKSIIFQQKWENPTPPLPFLDSCLEILVLAPGALLVATFCISFFTLRPCASKPLSFCLGGNFFSLPDPNTRHLIGVVAVSYLTQPFFPRRALLSKSRWRWFLASSMKLDFLKRAQQAYFDLPTGPFPPLAGPPSFSRFP